MTITNHTEYVVGDLFQSGDLVGIAIALRHDDSGDVICIRWPNSTGLYHTWVLESCYASIKKISNDQENIG